MSSPTSSIPSKRHLARLLLAGLLALVISEGVARLFTSPSRQVFDAELGWLWMPGAVAYNNAEGGARFVANELGFNDDPPRQKQPKLRIVGYGNSFLEAIQLPRAQHYGTLLEQAHPGLEFVNLGRSDMGPPHYPIVQHRFERPLAPDYRLVHLGEGDLMYLVRSGVTTKTEAGQLTDVHIGVATKDRIKQKFGPLLTRSALATYMMRRLKPMVAGWLKPKPIAAVPSRGDTEALRAQGYTRLIWVLRQLQKSGPLIVLNTPMLAYHPDGTVERTSPWESAAYQRAAAEVGAIYLDAGNEMAAVYRETGQPPFGFANFRPGIGHLNAAGHRAVLRTLERWLVAR